MTVETQIRLAPITALLGRRSHLDTDRVAEWRAELSDLPAPKIGAGDVPRLVALGYLVAQARLVSAGLAPERLNKGDCGAAAFGIASALRLVGVRLQLAIGHQKPVDPGTMVRTFDAPTRSRNGSIRLIQLRHAAPPAQPRDLEQDPLWVWHVGLTHNGLIFDSTGEIQLDDLAPEDTLYERGAMVSVTPLLGAQTWGFLREGTEWIISPAAYEASLIETLITFEAGLFRDDRALPETDSPTV